MKPPFFFFFYPPQRLSGARIHKKSHRYAGVFSMGTESGNACPRPATRLHPGAFPLFSALFPPPRAACGLWARAFPRPLWLSTGAV